MEESSNLLLKKGQTFLNLGNPKEALEIYEIILKDEPQNIEALIKKGHILGMIGRYVQAIDSYDKVLSQEESNLIALLNKGLAHHYLKEYEISISCNEKVLKTKPKNTTALYNKASSLVKSNKIQEGLNILAEAIKLDSSFKPKAKLDIDFEDIRKTSRFKELMNI